MNSCAGCIYIDSDGCCCSHPEYETKVFLFVMNKDTWDSCPEFTCEHSKPGTFEQAVDSILTDLRETLISKQKDYGPGNILSFGEFGVLVRTNDKLERLKNLHKSGKEPSNESVDDTWRDLAGYSIIALMLRRGIFNLPME